MGLIDQGKKIKKVVAETTMPTKFVFHHVPKCGGTSVGRALRKRYILSQVTVRPDESFHAFQAYTGRHDRDKMLIDVAALREQMMLYHLFNDERCISLHVPFSEIAYEKFSDKYKFITILREPVSRFVSHFFWSHQKPNDHARINEDFADFLETNRAKRMGASYVEYYSGEPMSDDLSSQELIDKATYNLTNRFDIVGSLNDLEDFSHKLKDVLGVRIKIGHENKARQPESTRKSSLTPELMERVREVCTPDIQVWEATAGAYYTSR